MNTPNNPSNIPQFDDDEISIKDIIQFFSQTWKSILGLGAVGLVLSLVFIFTATPQYEATAQIQMAQLRPRGNSQDKNNFVGINVEEPSLLMARFKLPTSYTDAEVNACGLEGKEHAKENLANSLIKMSQPKGLTLVEVKVQRSSETLAQSCAVAILERIRETQQAIKEPFVEEARQKIHVYQKQLQLSKDILIRADRAGNALLASYLAARDEVRVLQDQIIELEDFISSSEVRQAKLVSPIFVTDYPVYPKKSLSILLGLFAGLFLGVIFAVGRRVAKNWLV